MSINNNRFTITYNEQTGRYHIENASDNPLYNQDIVTATELARLDVIDKSITDWADCEDAETIWQKMVDGDSK